MGTVVSKAANGFGTVIGNAFAAPLKAIFGGSCEGICSGIWDITCFIEHLCISNLIKLLMVFGLSYITLLFFYLLFKLGICQCIGKSLCKMVWTACATCCYAQRDGTCFLWHKLKNVKRVNRRRARFPDVEAGFSSSGGIDLNVDQSPNVIRSKSMMRKTRKHHKSCGSFHPPRHERPYHSHHHHHHHHVDLKDRKVSVNIKEGPRGLKNSRHLQMRKSSDRMREMALSKRRMR